MRNIRGKFAGHKEIFGKHDAAAIRFRAGLDRTGGVHHVGFDERHPDILSARKEKGIRHAAAKDQDIDTCDQIFQNLQLGRHLGTTDNRGHRTGGIGKRVMERRQFLAKRTTGRGDLHQAWQRLDRGMRPMGTGKGVADINLAKSGQRCREIRIVGLLAGMEPQILHHQHIAVGKTFHCCVASGSGHIALDRHLAPQQCGQRRGNGCHRHFGNHLALWPAKMGQDHQPRPGLAKRPEPGKNPPDAGVVPDHPVGNRHIQIKPHKTPFAGGVDLVNEQKGRVHILFLIYPNHEHSLSA